MACILGISAHYHDAAAALVVDGKIVAALQEERISRVKNDPRLPLAAARVCLELAGLHPADLDEVVFYEEPFSRLERVLTASLRALPRGALGLSSVLRRQWASKLWVLDALAEGLEVPRARVTTRRHHQSHAASAFLPSPFPEAAILTVDGVGEATTTAIHHGRGTVIEELEHLEFPHSLGLLYAAFTSYLGFEVNEGEHQVMGLSAYGRPRYRGELGRILRVSADGTFELDPTALDLRGDADALHGPLLVALLGPPRRYKQPFGSFHNGAFQDADSQRYADVAASLQAALEEALLGLARRAKRATGASYLCLAGGVALNAVANRRLWQEAGFDDLFVQPAAGDAGGALGAALLGALDRGDPRPSALEHVALGRPLVPARAHAIGAEMGLRVTTPEDPVDEVARRLAQSQVVAWAQGRCEWGPRALGQRSILGRADSASVKDRIQHVVKRREGFRPFAPAVLESHASRFFDYRPGSMTPFMTTVCQVKTSDAAARALTGVTHVDGSARVQTVKAGGSFFELLTRLPQHGLEPVLLNTSLNGSGEPLATSEADVLGLFATSDLDALFLGELLFERSPR